MTQPRSYQINAPSGQITAIPLPAAPAAGSSSLTLSSSNYTSFVAGSATGAVGGNDVALPGIIVGNINTAITSLSAAQTFTITLISSSGISTPHTVILQSGDFQTLSGLYTTASLLAARINASSGLSGVASTTPDGYIKLVSPQSGPLAGITVTNGTGNICTALGIGASPVSANGSDVTRGLVTNSLDKLGGRAFVSISDGSAVLSTYAEYVQFSTDSAHPKYVLGQPIFGRTLASSSPSLTFSWKVKAYGSGPVLTSSSNFGGIAISDALTVNISDPSIQSALETFTCAFGAIPTSVTDVETALNSAYGAKRSGVVKGSVAEPFYFSSGDSFKFKVDGGSVNTVTLLPDTRTAADVAALINAQVSGIASNSSGYVRMATASTNGPSSSIEITEISDSVASKLGIYKGKYSGHYIATAVGSEIRFNPPTPGSVFSFSGSATTNMGLAASYTAAAYEQSVVWPTVYPSSFTPTAGYFVANIDEACEFGDIKTDQLTEERASSATSTTLPTFPASSALPKAGTPIKYDIYGKIGGSSVDGSTLSRVGRVNFPPLGANTNYNPFISVDYLNEFTPILEARQSGDLSLRQIADGSTNNDPKLYTTVNAYYDEQNNRFTADDSGQKASYLSVGKDTIKLGLKDTAAALWTTWDSEFTYKKSSAITNHFEWDMKGTTVLRNSTGALRISDNNIDDSSQNYINVSTSDDAGKFLRVGGKDGNSTVSVISSLNGRAYISCGDGTNTFGDFNGASALKDAIAFIAAYGILNVTIALKAGSYTTNTALSWTDKNIRIMGESRDVCNINYTGSGNLFNPTSSGSDIYTFELSNITITQAQTTTYSIYANNVKCIINHASVNGVSVSLASPDGDILGLEADGVVFTSWGINEAALDLNPGSLQVFGPDFNYPGVSVKNSTFNCNDDVNQRCIFITGTSSLVVPNTRGFERFEFINCDFNLSRCTTSAVSAIYRTPTIGTGIYELNPQDTWSLAIKEIALVNCRAYALSTDVNQFNVLLTGAPCLSSITTPPTFVGIVNSLRVDNCEFHAFIQNNSSKAGISCFTLGSGVGELTMVDSKIHYTSTNNSSYCDVPYWYKRTQQHGLDRIANITIDCPKTSISGLTISGCIRKSQPASTFMGVDLTLVSNALLNVNGLYIDYSSNVGSGDAPDCRVFFKTGVNNSEPSYDSYPLGLVEDVKLVGYTASTSVDWLNDGGSYIECRVKNFTFSDATVAGFGYSSPPSKEYWSAVSVTGLELSTVVADNIMIKNCRLTTGSTGIKLEYDTLEYAGNISIIDNFINVAGNYSVLQEYTRGISVWMYQNSDPQYSRLIKGNQIIITGAPYQGPNPPTSAGVLASAGIWAGLNEQSTVDGIGLSMIGNSITSKHDAGGVDKHIPAIFVATNIAATTGINPGAVIDSNICKEGGKPSAPGTLVGRIQAMRYDGTNFIPIQGTSATPYSARLLGAETTITGANATWVSGDPVIRNYAKLCNGVEPGTD